MYVNKLIFVGKVTFKTIIDTHSLLRLETQCDYMEEVSFDVRVVKQAKKFFDAYVNVDDFVYIEGHIGQGPCLMCTKLEKIGK